ncbi:MAG TPA: BsuPI-related putative proteinase inhibitor [Longimicrobiales bacterium]|nr:BsuPI-related putative proteinase inhibitor [Longimicrobiales bacterium]
MRRILMAMAVAWSGAACAARPPEAVEPGMAGAGPLAGTLEVEVTGDTARLTLHATNATEAPVRLEFTSAQRYEFEVWTLGGERLWQWSEGRAFAQVVTEEQLAAGGTLRERVAWSGARPGEYIAVGRLLAAGAPVSLSSRFRVPAR